MKCMSCESEISTKWKHAINSNQCPFCGNLIMEDHLKELLSELNDVVTELSTKYPDHLNDWMSSNSYTKSSKTSKDTKDTVKVKNGDSEREVSSADLYTDERRTGFFKRAEVIKKNDKFKTPTEKIEHIKNMVQKIKNGDSVEEDDDDSSVDIGDTAGDLSDDDYKHALTTSKELSGVSTGGGDDIPPEILAMAARGGRNNKEAADLAMLQRMHGRIRDSNDNFQNNGRSFKSSR